MQTMYALNPHLILSTDERIFLESLPANMPGVRVSVAEAGNVLTIYKKHVEAVVHPIKIGAELYGMMMTLKWPNKQKMSDIQAMRIVLNWVVDFNDKQVLNPDDYVKLLQETVQESFPAHQILYSKAYEKITMPIQKSGERMNAYRIYSNTPPMTIFCESVIREVIVVAKSEQEARDIVRKKHGDDFAVSFDGTTIEQITDESGPAILNVDYHRSHY